MSEERLERFSRIFKALSNPHRLRIILELAQCTPGSGMFTTTVDQVENCQQVFAKNLGLAPSTISHHFKELRLAGLLRIKRDGKNVLVSVNQEAIESMRNLF